MGNLVILYILICIINFFLIYKAINNDWFLLPTTITSFIISTLSIMLELHILIIILWLLITTFWFYLRFIFKDASDEND